MSIDEISAIHRRLDNQDEMLTAIHSAIVGNPAMGHRGLAARVEATEAKQADHDAKLIRWGGIATGVSLVVGLVKDKFLGH